MISLRDQRAPVWAIWGLIVVFRIIEAVAWFLAGGIPTRPGVLVQVIAAWTVMLILASLATRRIGTMAHKIAVQAHTHEETLDEIEQLQTQNAMLEIIARSVDVTLAFQALASRIARLVPCDRVGLALLTDNGQEFQTYTARVREEERRHEQPVVPRRPSVREGDEKEGEARNPQIVGPDPGREQDRGMDRLPQQTGEPKETEADHGRAHPALRAAPPDDQPARDEGRRGAH